MGALSSTKAQKEQSPSARSTSETLQRGVLSGISMRKPSPLEQEPGEETGEAPEESEKPGRLRSSSRLEFNFENTSGEEGRSWTTSLNEGTEVVGGPNEDPIEALGTDGLVCWPALMHAPSENL